MPFPVPTNLSPSRVEAFTSCPLAFRFASIEKLPEPPVVHPTKGSLVHRALELLFCRPPAERTLDAGLEALAAGRRGVPRRRPEFAGLELDAEAEARVPGRGRGAGRGATSPWRTRPPSGRSASSCYLEARVGRLHPAGHHRPARARRRRRARRHRLQDRAARRRCDREQQRLGGVHFYAYLCEQVFGRRPARIQLHVPAAPARSSSTRPSEQSIQFLPRRTAAVWHAVERACEAGDFRPRVGPLCDYCAFKPWCPACGRRPRPGGLRGAGRLRAGAVQLPAAHGVIDRRPTRRATTPVRSAVAAFDAAVDRPSTGCGATPSPTASSTPASALGDWSLLWHLLGVAQAAARDPTAGARPSGCRPCWRRVARREPRRQAALQAAPPRPVDGDRPHQLRTPGTSSFPSGHASAAVLRRRRCCPTATRRWRPCGSVGHRRGPQPVLRPASTTRPTSSAAPGRPRRSAELARGPVAPI